ncbi:MAG: hypothetical protein J3Q66DRAFT_322439 [Benniella sp.]|nr:MAG: hypothetical protein J3Q66DRAFT_322439 [Benniella sp.]
MSTIEEKVAAALANKDLGNEAFKEGKLVDALRLYHVAVLGLAGLDNQMAGLPMMSQMHPQEGAATETQKNEINEQLSVIYANMAACHLKKKTFERAIDVCNKALKYNAKNTKATFRRGQAKLALGDLTGAETDFESLGEGVPGVKAELQKLKLRSKEAEEKQRKTMGGFLSRGRILTEEDQKEEEAAEASASAAATASQTKSTPKSKPTLASKVNNQNKKPKPVVKEEGGGWKGTAPSSNDTPTATITEILDDDEDS